MTIKRVLFATKFGELNLEVLKSLFDLKPAGLEEILLTHIIPRDEVAFVPYGGYLKDEEARLRQEATIRFKDWEDDIRQAGLGVRICIEVGDPVPEIVKLAEAEKTNLIVCGKTRRTSLEKLYVGSRTLDLLRRSETIPVLVSKHLAVCDANGECVGLANDHPFRKVLFAADWSPPSERALQFLVALRGVVQKVNVVHVVTFKTSGEESQSQWEQIEAESRARLAGYCDVLGKAGIEAEPHLAAGETGSEIMRLSRELNPTMTILGTSGKDRLHAFFLGSLSQHIAERSELPTLLIP